MPLHSLSVCLLVIFVHKYVVREIDRERELCVCVCMCAPSQLRTSYTLNSYTISTWWWRKYPPFHASLYRQSHPSSIMHARTPVTYNSSSRVKPAPNGPSSHRYPLPPPPPLAADEEDEESSVFNSPSSVSSSNSECSMVMSRPLSLFGLHGLPRFVSVDAHMPYRPRNASISFFR